MPSVSQSQQRAAGMALAAKRGEIKPSELQGSAKEMYDSMDEKQLRDFAKTEHEGLPEKVEQEGKAYLRSRHGDDEDIRTKDVDVKKARKIGVDAGKAVVSKLNLKKESVDPDEYTKVRGSFTPQMMKQLKTSYSNITRVDPSSDPYKRLVKWLDKLNADQLKQIGDERINFLSNLAKNRLRKMGIKEGEIPSAPEDIQKLVDQFDRKQIEMGMDVEQEHNRGNTDVVQSPLDTLKIVLAHMKEDPEYYTHLKSMEDEYKVDESTTSRDLDYTTSDQELYAGDDPFENQEIDYPLKEGKYAVEDGMILLAHGTFAKGISSGKKYRVKPSTSDTVILYPIYGKKPAYKTYRSSIAGWIESGESGDKNGFTIVKEAVDPFKKFKVGDKVKYAKKDWHISSQTKDWIELEDSRGLTTIIDKDEIQSFNNGVLVTENDLRLMKEEMDRMIRSIK